jgi:arabinan endo-1,5-alpha-L-arabinosidase
MSSGITRRPLMIDPIIWENGWPTIKNLSPSYEENTGPKFFVSENNKE